MSSDKMIRQKFIEILYKKLRNRVTGENQNVCYDEKPSNKYFVGTLCLKQKEETTSGKKKTVVNPFNVGAEFLISKRDLKKTIIKILPKGCVYHKVFPTFKEQIEAARNFLKEVDSKANLEDEIRKQSEGKEDLSKASSIRVVFRKISFPKIWKQFSLEKCSEKEDFECEIKLDVKDIKDYLMKEWEKDGNRFIIKKFSDQKTKTRDIESKVPLSVLSDENRYKEFISSWGKGFKKPHWDFRVYCETMEFDDEHVLVSIKLENETSSRPGEDVEEFIFESGLEIEVLGAEIKPYILTRLKDDYKYDGNVEVNGINCVAIKRGNKIFTEHLPIYKQKRLTTQPNPQAKFSDLISDPLKTLNKIKEEMEKAYEIYKKQGEKLNLTEIGKQKFQRELEEFRIEIERFSNGIKCIKEYEDVKEAFVLMNKAFKNSPKGFSNWYLFQIVFIVMLIPDIICVKYPVKNYQEKVDILYFPTGGGKTEAYLGLVVFLIFWDRLRGKSEGCSAMTKFPLKLLSLQQLQRIANIFGQAELIRRKHPKLSQKPNKPFSLGFYVGDTNTPNKIFEKKGGIPINNLQRINQDEDIKKKWTIIQECPFCSSRNVELIADEKRWRIIHSCKDCKDGKEIPIYITDEEIYRYLPSFIVSTIDKIAYLGQSKKFRNILGLEKRKCPDHGYIWGKRCFVSEAPDPFKCEKSFEQFQVCEGVDLIPSLLIQDELHLIRESFGSFDSHYESFINHLIEVESNGRKKLKIIGATATMSETYSDQTRELYLREAIKFPSAGPKLNESFYAKEREDEIARFIIGLSAHNKSRIDTILDLIKFYREEILEFKKNPEKLVKMNIGVKNEDEAREIIREYETILSYHIRKSDGEAINTSIRTMVNPELKRKGLPPISFKSLTGDVTFGDVKDVLKSLEEGEEINLITATKFISHGVDIDMLNYMIFQGMPRSNAEYIQALSRVGRKFPGIVIIAFNTTYERDRSYYQYFLKFHEFRDMLVEAVPLSRWAKFSIEPTLGGIFCGTIFCHFDRKVFEKTLEDGKEGLEIHMSSWLKKALREYSEIFNEELVKEFVKKSYGLHIKPNHHFEKEIDSKIEHFFDCLEETSQNSYIKNVLERKKIKVMSSLRDIEKQIEISALRDKEIVEHSRGVEDTPDYEEDEE